MPAEQDWVAAAMPGRRARQLPEGACDTHNHVFGPFERFPLANPPDHPMPLAPFDTYLQMLDAVGLAYGVLVQPTQQGLDFGPMEHALKASKGRLRGVASASPSVSDEELERMVRAGVTGLRFVEAPLPSGAPRPGAVGFDDIAELAGRMREFGWSINVWGRMPTLLAGLDKLLAPGLPVVFEHMGMPDVEGGVGGGFRTLLALLREGRAWVKLSVCRCSHQAPGYDDLRPFADALVEANADRVLWGSDWPFIRMQGNEPDVTGLVELAIDWIGDDALASKLLCENPARLYGFPADPGAA